MVIPLRPKASEFSGREQEIKGKIQLFIDFPSIRMFQKSNSSSNTNNIFVCKSSSERIK